MAISSPLRDAAVWQDVRTCLRAMDAQFDRDEVKALDLAKGFAKLAQAFLLAMEVGGTGSSRFRAVVRALDLKTPASELRRFLANE